MDETALSGPLRPPGGLRPDFRPQGVSAGFPVPPSGQRPPGPRRKVGQHDGPDVSPQACLDVHRSLSNQSSVVVSWKSNRHSGHMPPGSWTLL